MFDDVSFPSEEELEVGSRLEVPFMRPRKMSKELSAPVVIHPKAGVGSVDILNNEGGLSHKDAMSSAIDQHKTVSHSRGDTIQQQEDRTKKSQAKLHSQEDSAAHASYQPQSCPQKRGNTWLASKQDGQTASSSSSSISSHGMPSRPSTNGQPEGPPIKPPSQMNRVSSSLTPQHSAKDFDAEQEKERIASLITSQVFLRIGETLEEDKAAGMTEMELDYTVMLAINHTLDHLFFKNNGLGGMETEAGRQQAMRGAMAGSAHTGMGLLLNSAGCMYVVCCMHFTIMLVLFCFKMSSKYQI